MHPTQTPSPHTLTNKQIINNQEMSAPSQIYDLKRDTSQCPNNIKAHDYLNRKFRNCINHGEISDDPYEHEEKNNQWNLHGRRSVQCNLKLKNNVFHFTLRKNGNATKREVCSRRRFEGACIDSGAAGSVKGLLKALAYCDATKARFILQPSNGTFRLGNNVFRSDGKLNIHIPTIQNDFITFEVNVIQADIPLLIVLKKLKRWRTITQLFAGQARTEGKWIFNPGNLQKRPLCRWQKH